MRQRQIFNRIILICLISSILLTQLPTHANAGNVNPSDTYIRTKIKEMALKYNVPSALLQVIAYQESGWRQFDANGNTIVGTNATSQDIGIMQINNRGRNDIERLMSDIDYNIEIGAKMLDGKWKLAADIGDGDRNVLENWYYAVWAYNGLSATNNPNTIGGRHYQDQVFALLAKQILANDGQPRWPCVSVTLPDISLMVTPPVWIPTPQPVHYGDLYNGFNSGDNFRVLESPASAVISTASVTPVSFLIQNVGTTTWDATYLPCLLIGDPLIQTSYAVAMASKVLPGGTSVVSFNLPANLPVGTLSLSFSMKKASYAFGAPWTTQLSVTDATAAVSFPDTVEIGQEMSIPFHISGESRMAVTPFFELRNSEGVIVDSSLSMSERYGGKTPGCDAIILPGASSGTMRMLIGTSGLESVPPGIYQLSVSFVANVAPLSGISGLTPFATFSHQLTILPSSQQGRLIVDSSAVASSVSIDGVMQDATTPCCIATTPGAHQVNIAKAAAVNVDTSVNPVSSITAAALPASPTLLVPVPVNFDFGVLKTGTGVTGQLFLSVSAPDKQLGVVSTSANWLHVSPLTFTGGQSFTVGIDARWIDPNTINTATITFTMGKISVVVPVKAGFAPVTAMHFSLVPQTVLVGRGDKFQANVVVRNMQLTFDAVDLTVAWDPMLIALDSTVLSGPLSSATQQQDTPGILRIYGSVSALTDAETTLASLSFSAIGASPKTGINLRGSATLAGKEVHTSMGGTSVSITVPFVSPGMPDGFAATGESMQVRLTWAESTKGTFDIAKYDLYREADNDDFSTAELIAEVLPPTTQFVDHWNIERKTYRYWIMAEDAKGNVSTPVGPIVATPIVYTHPAIDVQLDFAIGKPTLTINGVALVMDVSPAIQNSRTVIPIRYVATPLGAQVLWNPKEQKVTLDGIKKVELWVNKAQALVDGKEVLIDPSNTTVVPRIIDGRTMLPLRFIAETLGATVTFDAKKMTITIICHRPAS